MSRILHIVGSMDPATGGVAQAVRTVAASLAPLGHSSEVLCLDAPDAAYLKSAFDLPIHPCGPGKFGWAYNSKAGGWLEHNGISFDVWIVHGLWLYPGFVALRTRPEGNRLFVFPHGMLDPWFQSWRRRPLKTLRNYIFWHLVEFRLVNEADNLLFTCEEERRLARTTFGRYLPRAETVVGLGNEAPPPFDGVMESSFRTVCPMANGRRHILFLARLHPKKGVDLLLRAWAHLVQDFPPEKRRSLPLLVIAGPDGNDGYGEAMRTLAAELLPADAYHFTGMLEGAVKWGALYLADAFVLPSYQENFGIAVVEALACGTPVIVSNQVNIWREVVEAKGGMVTDASYGSLAKTLESWIRLPEEDRALFRNTARRCYESHFSASVAASRIDAAITV